MNRITMHRPRAVPARVAALAAVLLAIGLAACSSSGPPTGKLMFGNAPLEGGMFRITAHWRGAAPRNFEDQMLARAAKVARQEGGTTFSVVSADFEVTNTKYLLEDSPRTPVQLVPDDLPPEKPKPGEPAMYHAQMVIKVYRDGGAPEHTRLYSVTKIEGGPSPEPTASRGSVGFGVGIFRGSGSGGVGMGVGVQN